MLDDATVAALTFAGVGVLVAALGAYIRVRRRAGLLANYDGSADPDYAAVHAGNVAALVVTALAFVAAARAQGY